MCAKPKAKLVSKGLVILIVQGGGGGGGLHIRQMAGLSPPPPSPFKTGYLYNFYCSPLLFKLLNILRPTSVWTMAKTSSSCENLENFSKIRTLFHRNISPMHLGSFLVL